MALSSTVEGKTEKDGRRIQRIAISLPIRVEYRINQNNSWSEVTRLKDVSPFGAGFTLPRPVKRGRLVFMTIPLPRQLRCYDFMEPQYHVYGLVRTCLPLRNGSNADELYSVGTAFIGKNPPYSYLENPATLYELTQRGDEGFWQIDLAPNNPDESNLPKEHRRHSRYRIPVNVILETLDAEGNVIGGEMTVTENISLSGAAVFTTLPAEVGSFIRVTSEQYNISILSVVRGKRVGADGIPRLHIEFIDHFFPLEGIE
jgi:PilZ domain.